MAKKTLKISVNKEEIIPEFERQVPLFEGLRDQALFIVEKRLKESPIKFHSIPSRVKNLSSFLEKIDKRI